MLHWDPQHPIIINTDIDTVITMIITAAKGSVAISNFIFFLELEGGDEWAITCSAVSSLPRSERLVQLHITFKMLTLIVSGRYYTFDGRCLCTLAVQSSM